MKTRLLLLIACITFLSNCKKTNSEPASTTSYIKATVDGKNYNGNNVTVINDSYTNDLASFYAITTDSLLINIRLKPTLPSYQPGTYTFTPAHLQTATIETFSVKDSNLTNVLNWVTTQEVNTSYFEIQRSLDGINFSMLGNVPAAGNTSARMNYSFADYGSNTIQDYYYRLKVVSLDGSYQYSTVALYKGGYYLAYYAEKSVSYRGFNGTVDIITNDRTKRIVTGAFAFDFKDNNGKVRQVRNGEFKVSY
ncbi:MAG: hypothetical protein M3015_06490 [Bacteroidota bacterium]|nr:hypothetical protein [Bacteroidota bacterium]